ncbi:MAG TPA: molybdopterin-dependent oxidoreductase [Candidatus Competibacteraceae bacterium]|nr:molybdopterin-dependent oxidoreductase [Candidatus Competibacteraceae bacterium]
MTTRRIFLQGLAGGVVIAGGGLLRLPRAWAAVSLGPPSLPSGTLEGAVLEALPGKRPLIKRTYRPPNFETPVEHFSEPYTPNDAFFVRYHLPLIPEVGPPDWRLRIGGAAVERPLELTLEQLQRDFEHVEIAAVCQCSGNRRGLSDPHVPGVQWGYGAMGNALWQGVRLKDVLSRAGLKKEAVEIVFDGADSGYSAKTPDFVKSLPAWKAMDENTLLAWAMNGTLLPHWNGFPLRLVVPGWTATYWLKQLVSIEAVTSPYQGFWMKTAYRIPKDKFPLVDRFVSQEAEANTPITEMVVNSLILSPVEGQQVAGAAEVRGIAWDGGYGIQRVDVSSDGGQSWYSADLGPDLGRYAWRQWHYRFTPPQPGRYVLQARATNRLGASQTFTPIFNPAGYHHNAVHTVTIQSA